MLILDLRTFRPKEECGSKDQGVKFSTQTVEDKRLRWKTYSWEHGSRRGKITRLPLT